MERSLHKQLKELYTAGGGKREVLIDGFRVDALCDCSTILEIQLGPLVAIRRKLTALLAHYRVHLVKPLVIRRFFRWVGKDGALIWHRSDPRVTPTWQIFEDLVYFTNLFPHPNLTIRLPLATVEEHRLSPRTIAVRKRPSKKMPVLDIRLREIQGEIILRHAADLLQLLPAELPQPMDTASLSRLLDIPEWEARRIVYCLRECGVVRQVGYRKRFRTYILTERPKDQEKHPRAQAASRSPCPTPLPCFASPRPK